ncbi:MAG: molybdopterin-dependent oxidoreductase, partial [Coriobacteriia bacterium]|nr:molybdopterin-dependent oxidoreductase [Coriobacteriia bacterium]
MTNNWTDLGNSTLFVVMGANPSENHPASMAHINKARDKGAKLVVVDPRQTRTARQADRYIRIRPGTDIAFINGLVKYIIDQMEDPGSAVLPATKTAFFAHLNDASAGSFFPDVGTSVVSVAGVSKYTDARFLLTADGSDYDRETYVAGTNTYANFPKRAASVTANVDTVYNRLKQHVTPYDTATVAGICGCSEAELVWLAELYIANSRCSSVGNNPTVNYSGGYRATSMLYAMGLTQHTCGGQNVKSFAVLQTLLGNMGRAGGGINALRGIHNVQGSTDMGLLYHLIPGYSGNPTLMTAGHATPASNDVNAFGKYMDALWGNPLSSTAGRTNYDGSYDDAYNLTAGVMALQQRGFWNMT